MSGSIARNFYRFISNPVFLSSFFSWFIAQLIKAVIELYKKRGVSSRLLLATVFWRTGGMPSSHSSLVTALATSIGYIQGLDSPLFIIAFFYAILTIRDALGVRRAAGIQAQALNELAEELKSSLSFEFRPVKEIHGHTPAEVSVGVLLGFFIALAFCSL